MRYINTQPMLGGGVVRRIQINKSRSAPITMVQIEIILKALPGRAFTTPSIPNPQRARPINISV